MDAYCNTDPSMASCVDSIRKMNASLPLVALHDLGASGSTAAWRCYSPTCLENNNTAYRKGSGCKAFCSRDAQLAALEATCVAPAAAVFNLHTPDSHPDARCLDGSPAAFYIGTPAKPTTKWLIWGEGKAWCLSEADCVARATATDGRGGWTSSGWPSKPGCLPPTLPWGDAPCVPGKTAGQAWGCQLSNDCGLNPAFCDFNMVHLKTCDGGSWSGNRSSLSPSGLHYKGRAIVDATVAALQALGIGEATEIVIGGGSAGALGVYLQADRWLSMLDPSGEKKTCCRA